MRIVFIASEIFPFAKTGGLADVCGALPLALEKLGHRVDIIMPGYRCVGKQEEFSSLASRTIIGKDIRVYFISNKNFFDRPYLYGDAQGDYLDNLDRFSFFCHSAMTLLKELKEPVDIIHCHDWQTGLIPVLLKENYQQDPFFRGTKCVFTIHNLAYQGGFLKEEYAKLGVDKDLFNPRQIEFYEKINLMKSGIVFSDYVTTVSAQYAKEIQTKEFGCGLEGVLQLKKNQLVGILNGLDYDQWDPQIDVLLEDKKYDQKTAYIKQYHKKILQQHLGLPEQEDVPLFGFVGRLCYQKGFDLLEEVFDELLNRKIQLAFLGVGEARYQTLLKKISKKHPHQCAAWIDYDEKVSHQMYAGSDFFLMPSIYEPCGLTQMIALRYGVIPMVSQVGGLVDTIIDIETNQKQGNGILMKAYTKDGFLNAIDRCLNVYHQKQRMKDLIDHAMSCRFTWDLSAQHYVECYQTCLKLV